MTRTDNIVDGVLSNVIAAVLIGLGLVVALPWIVKKILPSFPSLPWGK